MLAKRKTPAERRAERMRVQYLRFAAAYVSNGRNATQAYLLIHPNVTVPSAGTRGGTMLMKVEVQAEIERLTNAALKREHMGADEALALTARIARLNPQDFYNADGTRKRLMDMTPEQARCVAGFKPTQFGTEMMFRDADKALGHVLKINKLLTDKVDVSVTMSLDKLIEQSYGENKDSA